jgi:DNA-directed RNA polymerase alpha subunit
MLSVEKVSIVEKSIKHTPELDNIAKSVEKFNGINVYELLPKNTWHEVSFELHKTYAGFANAIRRVLIEEIPVVCATVNDGQILSDDEFIRGLTVLLVKNINLTPINQELNYDARDFTISLNVFNNSNEIIDVTTGDFTVESKNNIKVSDVFTNLNIVLIRLRPMKYLKIGELTFERGAGYIDSAKFSLLNNVNYKPLDIVPYDIYTGGGTRTAEYDCKQFYISYTTAGNISPSKVLELTTNHLTTQLKLMRQLIVEYATILKEDPQKKHYESAKLTVVNIDDVNCYKFINLYFTLVNMVGQRCFLIDTNILHCSASVDRYDTQLGIIKLKHADPNNLLIESIDLCLADLLIVAKAF